PGAACTSACTSQPTDCANRLPFLPPARRALARLSGSNLATSGARASKASFTCAASPVLSVDTKPCANISSPIITADCKTHNDQRWTVPLGGGLGRIFRVGRQPLNTYLQAFGHVEHPRGAAGWSLRLQTQLLVPK